MTHALPPKDYEDLIRLIHERHDQMSKTYQRISVFLTQNPNDVAVQSVNAIADRCGIHASSFVRFAQALGYKGFKELQSLFQRRLATAAPGFEARVKALETELHTSGDRNEFGFLSDLVVRDIASLQEMLTDIRQEDLVEAATLLQHAETIYLIGQMRSLPVVELMRYQLTMIGKRCILLDSAGGISTYVARTMTKRDVLMAVSFRFYAKEVVDVVDEAGARGMDVIAISDSTLSPFAKSAKVLFPVPEHDYTFSRSLAAPMCLAQALTISVAARVQQNADAPRIPTVTGT
ncbi:MurR/RpiR family transcriptional regulator [Paracoccus methylovorus]|uniref:MurR/RpiR family transcriptional regulator n=1 Tax=Paracoccus methylovorus TaxID=2812658 RepID=A0ABX7JKY4_9RHOB|nr:MULTISPECIES: MurR/RpiR family transcriptional regulator [Paracoccus]QRZ14775.1 MurR/RpiR family transcriptional regulator [Paracoccus methylovorus]